MGRLFAGVTIFHTRNKMIISKQWLKEKDACPEVIAEFIGQSETDGVRFVKKCIKMKNLDWANWLIVRIMDYRQCVSYAVFAAELALPFFVKKYPNDNRPLEAIEAAKKCLENPSEENKKIAYAAASASAVASAYAADAAAYTAYAYAAASAYAYAAAYTAYAAAAAYAYTAYTVASYVYADAKEKMKLKILNYGIKLLEEAADAKN